MNESLTRTLSRQEMAKLAQDFIVDNYGKAKDSDDKDAWYTRLGMLLDFVYGVISAD
jgi:hypothetical protein